MEWVETTAKSVDAAKELALDQLHVEEADAEFEILEEPRPGLFGRMRGEARVRARVRPVQPRPKVDRRERRRGTRRQGGGSGGGSRRRESTETTEETPTDDARSDQERSGGSDRRQGARKGGGERTSSRNKEGERRPRQSANATSDKSQNEESAVSDTVSVEKQAEIVQEFLEGLVDAFGYEGATVAIESIDEETSEVQVDGEDLGLLVGPRGATLQAIHDLSRTVVQRAEPGTHEGRVRIDVAGYRQRRREALERFTQKLATEALETGIAQVLEPMSAADRKVVHDTVNEIDGVHTTSEGEDARRHVVIVPDAD